jgi:hypothetical protein
MTSVGLLCRQYLGAKRDNPMMIAGTQYLMNNMPDVNRSNVYYWYYATQVLHNMNGYEWDQWNRKMRKLLVETQNRDSGSCANGSWDPAKDQWGKSGGRIMMTSLAALTLEIYYRYLPLFKADNEGGAAPAAKDDGKAAKPAPAKAEAAADADDDAADAVAKTAGKVNTKNAPAKDAPKADAKKAPAKAPAKGAKAKAKTEKGGDDK